MNLFNKIKFVIDTEGFSGLIWRIKRLFIPTVSKLYKKNKDVFINKSAIEIGGPSKIFNSDSLMPIYSQLKIVDGCNFSDNTVWEGKILAGVDKYVYDDLKKGKQYINEGSDLSTIPSENYDILLSCHSLEHIANPIKALKEWVRVLKPQGHILLILPHPQYTFDHKRPITTLEHLISDYKNNTDETDLSCLEEVVELHNLNRDFVGPKTREDLRERGLNNIENRCLHHHVFDFDLIKKLFQYCDMELVDSEFIRTCNMVALGKKIG